MLKPSGDHPGQSTFIPSIEGMRALAVLAVLLFHLDVSFFSGGFLGVDLFFVISGFIITRNILIDINSERFTLREFYLRRFFRLFPSLIVTLIVGLLLATIFMPPRELILAAQSAIYATFSLANFYFWSQAGYFDVAAHTKPFLHTWSLSVEEQFYLLWPGLLLLASRRNKALLLACSLLAVSVVAALVWMAESPDAVFYLLPFRVHQLMAGAAIALLLIRLPVLAGDICTLLATVGFVLLVAPFSFEYSAAQGGLLLSLIGVLFLLGRESRAANLIFSNGMMLWIGKRSYVLYLVHWPAVVLFKYSTDFDLDGFEQLSLFTASMLLAMALHRYVEKPFRIRRVSEISERNLANSMAAGTLAASLILSASIIYFDGFGSRTDPRIQEIVESYASERELRLQFNRTGTCSLGYNTQLSDYDTDVCAPFDRSEVNVLVVGDSLAADAYSMLTQTYPAVNFSQATAMACPALLDLEGNPRKVCRELNHLRFTELAERDYDLIILASNWPQYPHSIPRLRRTADYLKELDRDFVILGPRPFFSENPALIIALQNEVADINHRIDKLAKVDREFLERMRTAIPDARIIDMNSIQCTPSCDVMMDDRLLYVDHIHWSRFGAKVFGDRLVQYIDVPGQMHSGPGS